MQPSLRQVPPRSDGSNTVTLTCATAQAIDNGRDFYIALPAIDSLKSITLTSDDGRYCTKIVKSNVCINVQRSAVTEIEFDENDLNFILPEGTLPGLFSVSATQQVRFSQGNLQYQASTDTWRFAENQYDYVDYDNINISATYSGWIDLFGWGTGSNPTLASTNNSDYSTFVDWGVNPISNGGNTANLWRTLSQSEWTYLLNTRDNASAKIATGSVNGVHGLILLPDSWMQPEGCTFNAGFATSTTDWSRNRYTIAQWAMMEEAGALFLPDAHSRYWFDGYGWDIAINGSYWSSTPVDYTYDWTTHTFLHDDNHAAFIHFNGSYTGAYSAERYEGNAVRLVRNNN